MAHKSFAISQLQAKEFNYIHCQIIKDWLLAYRKEELEASDIGRWLQDMGYSCPTLHRDKPLYTVYHIDTHKSMEFDV